MNNLNNGISTHNENSLHMRSSSSLNRLNNLNNLNNLNDLNNLNNLQVMRDMPNVNGGHGGRYGNYGNYDNGYDHSNVNFLNNIDRNNGNNAVEITKDRNKIGNVTFDDIIVPIDQTGEKYNCLVCAAHNMSSTNAIKHGNIHLLHQTQGFSLIMDRRGDYQCLRCKHVVNMAVYKFHWTKCQQQMDIQNMIENQMNMSSQAVAQTRQDHHVFATQGDVNLTAKTIRNANH